MKKLLFINFIILYLIMTGCAIENKDMDNSSSFTPTNAVVDANENERANFVLSYGNAFIYYTSNSYYGPAEVVKVSKDWQEKKVLCSFDKGIDRIGFKNEKVLFINIISKVELEYKEIETYEFDLQNNELKKIDIIKIINEDKMHFDDHFYKYGQEIFLFKHYGDYDTYYYTTDIYVKKDDLSLVCEEVIQYQFTKDKIYYIQYEDCETNIYSIDYSGKNKQKIITTNSLQNFDVCSNKLIFQNAKALNIYDLNTLKLFEIKKDTEMRLFFGNCIFQETSFFICNSEKGIQKYSYSGELIETINPGLTTYNISLIENTIFFTVDNSSKNPVTTDYYAMKENGKDLKKIK